MPLPEKILPHVQPSGLNSKFEFSKINFSAYSAAVKNIIRTVNKTSGRGLTEEQIELNAPFEWRPEKPVKKGVLLIHGLFDSPFIMRDIGKHFLDKGFLVRSILLPGHGTIPADLLTTSLKEWIKATLYGVNSFRNEVDELYLAGFSTGASLALNYVLDNPPAKPKIAGLIMLSPAFALNTKSSISVRLYRMFRWLFKEHKWVVRSDSPDYCKYISYPVNSAYLIQRLILENKLLLQEKTPTVPTFIAMSQDDETVRVQPVLDYFKKTKNPLNRFLLYSNSRLKNKDSRISEKRSEKLDEDIIDFSHVSVLTSPDNKHYGRNGDHKEPLHEPKGSSERDKIYLGTNTPENEELYRFRRLTYNPYFDELMQTIDAFIESTT